MTSIINCITGDKQTIIDSARNLFDIAANCMPAIRIVHLSSMAVYGSTTGAVTESSPLSDDLGPYAEAKIAVEMLARHHNNVICLRPGIVYGPQSAWWSDRIARLLIARRLGNLGSKGNGICNLVYVDDVAQAAIAAVKMNTSEPRVFNLTNPVAITWNDYFDAYSKALGVGAPKEISALRLWTELKLLAIVYKAGEIVASKHALKGWHPTPAIRPWLIHLCQHSIKLDTSLASQYLGMHWTPIENGLNVTAQWYLSGGRR